MSGDSSVSRSSPEQITMAGHVSIEDKEEGDFRYLPFPLPAGVQSIHVRYDYGRTSMAAARQGEENVLDLGIFAPGLKDGRPNAFRGWSGGARTDFFVGRDDATPGYLPGPLPEGLWHVVLGLYRIAPDGCDYTVTIRLETDSAVKHTSSDRDSDGSSGPLSERERGTRPKIDVATEPGGQWYVGDLQSHTWHSDANASPNQIARVAMHRGLDYLAVTDHNTISHHPELGRLSTNGLLLVPGMELTTNYGHANIWGLSRWVDFRHRSAVEVAQSFADAHEQDALVSLNHPFSDCPWTFGFIDGVDAIEVWQGLWNRGNARAVAWWDELLTSGHRVTGVGGSDRHEPAAYDPHFPHQVGTPATAILAENLTTPAILAGIARGNVTIAESPGGPWLHMGVQRKDGVGASAGGTLEPDTELTVICRVSGAGEDTVEIIADGRTIASRPVSAGDETLELRIKVPNCSYVRAQLVAGHGKEILVDESYPLVRALCNPVYFSRSRNDRRAVSLERG